MKTIITTLITLTAFLGHSQWSQVHETIYGTSGGDDTGREVAISASGNIIAITATGASMGGFVRGRVQVFEDDGASWVQLGTDIGGENNGDRFGNAVAMNTTGDIIAVGAQYHDELASNAGQVKVFQYDGVDWNQLGLDLLGENGSDYFGGAVDLSGDGLTVAVGARNYDGAGSNAGGVWVYEYTAGVWTLKGSVLNGAAAGDSFGADVALSTGGDTLIVGSPGFDVLGTSRGAARVYEYTGGTWVQIGSDILGEADFDATGSAVEISNDGTIIAVGDMTNDENGLSAGQVRVFSLDAGDWVQMGSDIYGANPGDEFGETIDMTADGLTISVGARNAAGEAPGAGAVRVLTFDGLDWNMVETEINGLVTGDLCYRSALSSDGNSIIVGAENQRNEASISTGAARVFSLSPCLPTTSPFAVSDCESYTVPSGDETYTTIGTYDVMDTIPNFCGVDSVMTITVTIFGLPTVEANVVDDLTEICLEDEITLFGSGATSYSWDVLDVTDGDPYEPTTTGTTTYTVTGTDDNGCSNTASIDILVNELPTVTASVDDAEICIGDEVTFTGGGTADTYDWDEGVTDGDLYEPPATGTTTYAVTGTITATGCINTATVDVLVHELPTVTASVDDAEICLIDQITFTGGGADTYTWDEGVIDGELFEPTTAETTTYTVTGTDGNGCVNTASVDVLVFALPTVTANADPSQVCIGEELTLTGGGATTYVWDNDVEDGIAFEPILGTTTYTVTGTDDNGCVNTASIDVTVFDLPTVIANVNTNELCLGNEVTFSGSGAETYTWDNGVTDNTPYLPTLIGTETYTVIGTDENGCQNSASIDVTVLELPEVIASADTSIYPGESTLIQASSVSNGTYLWSPEQDLACPTCNETDASPVSTRTYTITFTDENGCQATDQVVITLLDLIVATEIGISPNGDGDNDALVFPGILAYPNSSIQIFNRWGVAVFTAENGYQNDWGGTNQNTGDLLPNNSTCFFILDLGEEGTEPIKGYVYISF